ncbi:MAG: hypothetical protein GY711_08765 [bacterium]|nr:hypothetical protein [bacterium]
MQSYDPQATLIAVQVLTIIGLGVVARARLRRDPKIGRPLFIELDSGGFKPVMFAVQTGLLIIALRTDGFPALFSALTLYGTGVLTWLAPGAGDRACGEEGAFCGWYGRRYEDLEAWRIKEGRFSFPLSGQWAEIDVPPDKRARLHKILSGVCPEREVVAGE